MIYTEIILFSFWRKESDLLFNKILNQERASAISPYLDKNISLRSQVMIWSLEEIVCFMSPTSLLEMEFSMSSQDMKSPTLVEKNLTNQRLNISLPS